MICAGMIMIGLLSYFWQTGSREKQPKVEQGVIDLVQWDLAGGGTIKLDGDWEFYWKELLEPSDFAGGKKPAADNYFSVPNKWNNYKPGESPTGDGYGTYRVKIKLHAPGKYLTIQMPDVATAYQLYIDGQLLCTVGTVGQDAASVKPQYLPQIVSFHTDGQEVEIIIQAANFAHQKGGIKSSIWLGLDQAGHQQRANKMGFELFILGIFFIMSLYHFGLYLLRKKDKPALYFGLFCLLIAIRTMTTGEIVIMSMFPNLDWEILIKIEYLSYYLSVPVFVKFIYHLYAAGTSAKITNGIRTASLIFAGLVIFMPVKYFVKTLLWYDGITLLACIYIGRMLISAIKERQEGADYFVWGVFIFLGTVINDMFFAQGVFPTREMVPIGLFIFIFYQALALSTKSARAYAKLEKVSTELQSSNDKVIHILESITDGFFALDNQTRFTYINREAESLLQRSQEELLGKIIWDEFPDSKKVLRHGHYLRELAEKKPVHFEFFSDRLALWLEVNVYPSQEGLSVFLRNIQERKQIEKEMARLDRLNLIGEMAASISHEVRNPMTTVRGFLQLLGKKECNLKYKEYYELMLSELDRANNILNEYLSVSRPRESDFKLQSINDIFNSLTPLLQADAFKCGKRIEFELGDVPEVVLDGGEIRQLILNLCRNGLEAMADGGEVIKITTYLQGEEVVLSIRDEGEGIPKEIMGKLGTPFLSTKDNGTGLGLAVCYSIATRHKARIEVSSNAEGTTFVIKFKKTIADF